MANNEKPKSVFFHISDALRGNKKDVADTLNKSKDLLINEPGISNYDFNNIQQKQQEFLDVQSLKIAQDLYARTVYYDSDRISSYNDFRAMDQSPEISVALDIMADECVTRGELGEILTIYSEDTRIKKILKTLFYQTLNVNRNLRFWTRELLKYGDNFLKLEIDQKLGIYDAIQMPTGEIHKELGVDGNPKSVRYKWDGKNMFFEDFEMAHFSLLADGTKLPYGRSVLDPARKLWKQLQLAEDAMLVYRLCLVGNSRIKTDTGYEYIKNLQVGSQVLSYNFDGQLEKSTVTHHVNNGVKKVYKVKSRHNEIIGTETHPILINRNGIIQYVDIKDIKIKSDKFINTNTLDLPFVKKEINTSFAPEFSTLTNEGLNYFKNIRATYNNISENIRSIPTIDNYGFERYKQFLYTKGKGLPSNVADTVCEVLEIPKNFLIKHNKNQINPELINVPKYINEELAQLFGFLIGDGFLLANNNGIGFAEGTNKERNLFYANLLKKYFGKCTYVKDNRENRNYGKYITTSTTAAKIFIDLGFLKHASKKRIPQWTFTERPEIRKALIIGITEADGCIRYTKKGTWFCTIELCNKNLIEDIKELWNSINLSSGHIKTRNRKGGFRKSLNRVIKDTVSHNITLSQLPLPTYENVISVEYVGEEEVFDITVDNKLHNFIANGIPVHNTRAPERRIFYLDVGNSDPADIRQYIESMKRELKKQPVVDARTGNINMKFNPVTFEEDYFIPVRGGVSSKVETLPGACLSLDTRIPLLDGRTLTLQEIINEYDSGNDNLWIYSCNPETGEFAPGLVSWAGITRKNTKVMKITLDNEKEIICTPDHKLVHRTNKFVRADKLNVGDSLMPFYNKKEIYYKNYDYEKIFDNKTQKWIWTHKAVANFHKNDLIKETTFLEKYKNSNHQTIHHVNFNRYDNSPQNLTFMNNKDHFAYHWSKQEFAAKAYSEKYHNNPEFAEQVKNRLAKGNKTFHNKRNNNPEYKELIRSKQKEAINKYFDNLTPDEIKQWCKRIHNPETSEKTTKKLLEWCKNPENLKLRGKIMSIVKSTPEAKEKISITFKKLWTTPGFREKVFSKEQKITFTDKMYNMFVSEFEKHLRADLTLEVLNSNSEFMNEFICNNIEIRSSITNLNEFTHNHLDKMIKEKGFKNFKEWKKNESILRGYINLRQWKYYFDKEKANKIDKFYNHKIIKIEYLEDTIDTGTITVDGHELYHNFHTFALESGVYVKNSNLNDIADIDYLQNKLFTAIKVPKTYLNYGEALPGGSTLSQADLRFSRTINFFQETLVEELRRIANIHLYILGFSDDLDNFTLTLTNPSTQQELLKLETMKARNDVFKEMFSSDATSPVSYAWAMEFILGFSKSEIKQILRQKKIERRMFYEIERGHVEYLDTGIFQELDKKFRRPDFDPNTEIDPDAEGVGGDDAGGGGGGFGGGSSFGGMDLGGGMDMGGADDFGADDTGDLDMGSPDAMPPGAELADVDEPQEEPEDNLKETNTLLKKNKLFNFKMKTLLEGIEHYLTKPNTTDQTDNQK